MAKEKKREKHMHGICMIKEKPKKNFDWVASISLDSAS